MTKILDNKFIWNGHDETCVAHIIDTGGHLSYCGKPKHEIAPGRYRLYSCELKGGRAICKKCQAENQRRMAAAYGLMNWKPV